MLDPGLGGKGRKAPYNSTLVRVPLPLKPLIVSLIFTWRNCLGGIIDPNGSELVRQVESAIATASPEHIAVNELELADKVVNKLDQQSENAFLLKRLETAERLIGRRLLEMALREEQTQKKQEMAIAKLAEENSSLRHQLDNLAVKASFWASRAQDAEAKLDVLQSEITQLRSSAT